ncbi:MAG TPA: GDSL-type esterase/lipase family protein [Acetobacteraceae bacterium]|nr:GDSL-type esterase/lipase family protein [Acetobacteraceae bacterium]
MGRIVARIGARRWIRGAALLALFLLGGSGGGHAGDVNLAMAPISRMDLPWWRQRFEEKETELRTRKAALVWYGDSITENWEREGPPAWRNFAPVWQRFYGGRDAINLGFIGDSTANLIWRIMNGEADGIAPKVAIVEIGANNFGLPHWPASETVPGIESVVRLLREHLPGTGIVLLSVLPSERSEWVSDNTVLTNDALARIYAGNRTVHFIDLTGLFMKDGKLDRSLFLDQYLSPPEPLLHPTAEGMEKIAAAIEPTIAELMEDRDRDLSAGLPLARVQTSP